MEDISQQIAKFRRDYGSQELEEKSVLSTPIEQFKTWFQEAINAGQVDVEAMTLSTVNEQGRVSCRVVLLKDCDAQGFVFFTNYNSRKAREMQAQANVALTFYWPALQRQVRIEGSVGKTSREESEAYFQTRPRGAQIGAWASPQSELIENRRALEEQIAAIEDRFRDQSIPCPPFWGGFRLVPERIEFWQGRESRLHDRILYTLVQGEWKISRLAP